LPENWRLPLWQQAPDRVFYVASFSKYFAGGLRAGYVLAPTLWQQTLINQIHSQCWAVSMINFELLMRAIKSKEFDYNQDKLANEIRYRINALKAVFENHNITAIFSGLNVYIPLPLDLNMHALAGQLKANQVEVRTLDVFESPTQPPNNELNGLRFTLGGPSSRAEFDQGVKRVEDVFTQLRKRPSIVI
jgi:DNA-binding transcriptional MocR family regulator